MLRSVATRVAGRFRFGVVYTVLLRIDRLQR